MIYFLSYSAALALYGIGGIESEETYPFEGNKSKKQCHFNQGDIVAYVDNGYFINVVESNVARMLNENGHLANHMNAAPRSFQFYSHGKDHYDYGSINYY